MKSMKKLLAAVLALMMVFALTACSQAGGQGDGPQTLEEGKLILSTNAEFPPYEMIADGEGWNGTGFEGIDIEVAGAIAEKLGLELVIDNVSFDASLLAVQNGQSDIAMAGITVDETRLQVMDFTDSYATGVQVVIIKEGSDVTMDNLGEHLIGAAQGYTGYIYASDTPENGGYGEDHVIGYENGAMAVEALKNGQIDAVIIDDAPAKVFVESNPGLTLLEGEWVTEDYAIGVKKGNTQLLEAVNKALNELIEDGTVQKIIDMYIPAD